MSEYRREMEQEKFSSEEFVERLGWRTVTSGDEFDPEKLHATFSEAIADLESILEMQRLKCTQVENTFMKEEQLLRNRLMMLMNRNQMATDNLSVLEKKVNSVATKVVRLGDQLESVNLPRERANEAAKLMKHLAEFLNPGSIRVSDVFRDLKENLYEAADIILKLHMVAQDLTTGGTSSRFDTAVKQINQKYDEIERLLIEEFVSAQRIDDREKMKQLAAILYNFKGYSQCINAFIEQSQIGGFMSKDVFEDVLPLCRANKFVIDAVFPNPTQVMGKFVLYIFHGRIQGVVADQLSEKDERGHQDKFLRNLAHLYGRTTKLIREFETFDLGGDSTFLERITEQIFRKHLENYIRIEKDCLQAKNNRILAHYYESLGHQKRIVQSSFQDIRRDLQAVIGTRANINIAQIEHYGGETFLSEEVAINLLQESRMAYSRCKLLSKSQDVAVNSAFIFDMLTYSLLKEHVDYALEIGLQAIPIAEPKAPPKIYFFDLVKSCNAIVHLYEKEFLDSLLPLVRTSPCMNECLEKKKYFLEQVEFKIDAGIDRALDTVVSWVRVILQAENSRKDFFRSESDSDENPDMVSSACVKVVRFMTSQVEKIKDSMDGKNVEAVLTELGTRFHRVIYEHLLQFQYSSVGAFSVICDVGEYRKCVKEFKIPLLNTVFDTLHALCNLLMVLPKDLNQYFHREELASLDPSIRHNFVQLRTDFRRLPDYA